MSDTKNPRQQGSIPVGTAVAILAAVIVAGIVATIGSLNTLGSLEANAAPVELPVLEQAASGEAHGAFIRQGHARAAVEGDESPLPPTF